jgi:hypothetical protein
MSDEPRKTINLPFSPEDVRLGRLDTIERAENERDILAAKLAVAATIISGMLGYMESTEVTLDNEWGDCRDLARLEADGALNPLVPEARAFADTLPERAAAMLAVVDAADNCSWNEPSLSVLQRAVDRLKAVRGRGGRDGK